MRPNRAPVRTSYLPVLMAAVVIVGCDADVPSQPTADVAAPLAAAKPGVEPVCHFDPRAGGFVRLDVPAPGAVAHRGHGDAAPGEPVPGTVGFSFDDLCQSQEVPFSELEQLAPISGSYESLPFEGSGEGEVTGNVIPVDINLDGNRLNTSGCEESDFAALDFSGPNDIALLQRSGCEFWFTTAYAVAAGAEAVIFFNQGNTPERHGVIAGNASNGGTIDHGVPVVGTTFAAGAALAQPGSTARVRTQIPD